MRYWGNKISPDERKNERDGRTGQPENNVCGVAKAYLEEASTQKSAKTHAGNVFVTRDLDI